MMLLLAAAAFAAEPRVLSLDDALGLSRSASESLRIAAADTRRADADKAAAFGGYLPSLSSALSYSHTFLSEYDNLFDTGATGGTNPFADLPFGAADTWRLDLSLSETVYGGGRVRAQNQLAVANQRYAALGAVAAEAAHTYDVASAYLDAALSARLAEITRAALAQAEVTLRHATEAAKVGRQPEFEVLRAGVEVENQRVLVLQQERYATLADARLKQLLGLPVDDAVTLATRLEDVSAPAATAAPTERVAVRQGEAGVAIAESSVKLTRSAGLPQVAISGTAGFVAYPDNPLPPLEDWRTNLTAGASVSMPLFAGGTVRAQVQGAQADLAKARAQAQQLAELVELDTRDALTALDTARAQWAATEGTVAQAQKAYDIGEVRFAEGISTQAELADARLLLQRAQANRAQAGRDLRLAALRVQLLHDLPLSSR